MYSNKTILLIAISLLVAGCSQWQANTQNGAIAGGAAGAGVGAIIGGASGDTGTGLAIGTVAGAATGAWVGSEFESRDQIIANQDQSLARQEQIVDAQKQEINELRRASEDAFSTSSYKSPSADIRGAYNPPAQARGFDNGTLSNRAAAVQAPVATARGNDVSWNHNNPTGGTIQRAENDNAAVMVKRGSVGSVQTQTFSASSPDINEARTAASSRDIMPVAPKQVAPVARVASTTTFNTPECKQASDEVQRASGASEVSDKLFHFRRALRLCPENPQYHNGLGEIYLSLKRQVDAEFEFKEALNLDPSYEPAKANLARLQ